MSEEEIKNHFGNVVIYKYIGKLDNIKKYQEEDGNSSTFLSIGKTIYFTCTNECSKEDVVVEYDNREGVV